MIYKLLKANYVNKNNVSYSEECIDKMIEQYNDTKFNVYCAEDVDFLEFNDEPDFYKDKTIYGKISNLRKEDDYLICDLEFDSAESTYEDGICKVNECKIIVHFFKNLTMSMKQRANSEKL